MAKYTFKILVYKVKYRFNGLELSLFFKEEIVTKAENVCFISLDMPRVFILSCLIHDTSNTYVCLLVVANETID
jgi:hypothetical protein